MKGLLHRLAGRAAGTALLVRSAARLSFGSGGLAWADEPLNANSGPVREMLPATVAARPDAAMQWVEPGSRRASVLTSTEASIEALAKAPAMPSLRQAHPRPTVALRDSMLQSTNPSAPQPPVSERHDGLPHEPEAHGGEAAPVVVSQMPEPRVPAAAPLLATGIPVEPDNRTRTPAVAHLPNGSTRRATTPALVEPALLMPPARVQVDASMPLIAPQNAARQFPPASQALDDTTEVHIHIGRIDVTAVHEAPAPHIQPRKRQAPMSLDAYLAARSKA